MSLFSKSSKAKFVEEKPQKMQLDLDSEGSDNMVDNLQMQHAENIKRQWEEAEEYEEPEYPYYQDLTKYDPRTDIAENPEQLKSRIQRVRYVLADFRNRRNADLERQQYIELLRSDVERLYGYSQETAEILLGLFGPDAFVLFVEACETQRPLVIRVNTLKLKRKELTQMLSQRGVEVEPVAYCNEALTVYKSQVPIGATPEYLRGFYMPQDAASLLPVLALNPKAGERVMDMASAPGGKTTHMCYLMDNQGLIVANDANIQRIAALQSNLSRMGCINAIVCCYQAQDIPFRGFDRILLDAPCTGLGVISKDARVKMTKTKSELHRMQQLQRRLLWKALDCLNGSQDSPRLVCYSTCSVSVAENEQVVDWVIRERGDCQVIDSGLKIGMPGLKSFREKQFCHNMQLARRFYPHVHNVYGFFLCLIQLKPGCKCKYDLFKEEKMQMDKNRQISLEKYYNGGEYPSKQQQPENDAYLSSNSENETLENEYIEEEYESYYENEYESTLSDEY